MLVQGATFQNNPHIQLTIHKICDPKVSVFPPGVTSIYVVNHPLDKDYDTVERFTWDGNKKTLTHVRTISDPSFRLWVNWPNIFRLIVAGWYTLMMSLHNFCSASEWCSLCDKGELMRHVVVMGCFALLVLWEGNPSVTTGLPHKWTVVLGLAENTVCGPSFRS